MDEDLLEQVVGWIGGDRGSVSVGSGFRRITPCSEFTGWKDDKPSHVS